jgi:hypothetical protein
MTTEDEARAVDQVAARLASRFPSAPGDRVAELVGSIHHRFDGAPIRDFVPILVEHAARDQLTQLVGA